MIEARSKFHGEEHPDTLAVVSNLGETYRNQGIRAASQDDRNEIKADWEDSSGHNKQHEQTRIDSPIARSGK